MGYQPKPEILDDIELSGDLKQAVARIAQNTHEVWACGRMSLGWRYGDELNQDEKKHPDLKPYEELTDEEKEFDIRTTEQVIKMLIKMGYVIEKRT